jgi:hypothetical protein
MRGDAAAELIAPTPNTRSRFAELSLGRRSLQLLAGGLKPDIGVN